MDSFSSDQIVCSLGEAFHTKQPDFIFLRMIISLLFEPFSNSSLQHLRFVCAIWHDCIFGGNGRLYTGFWVVLSLSTLYIWLAGKAKTKQAVNRMSEWVEGGGSWKGHESGQAVIFLAARSCFLQNRHGTRATLQYIYVTNIWLRKCLFIPSNNHHFHMVEICQHFWNVFLNVKKE